MIEGGGAPDQKMVLIAFGVALDSEIVDSLEDLGLCAYTRWVRVHGVGTHSPPHLDTHVWPGTNHVLALVVAADQVSALLERLRGIKSAAAQEGLRAFVLPVEDGV